MTPKHKTTDGFPVTLTVAETARILDVAPATMYAWIRHDEIPSLRLGGRVRVPTARLADLVGVDPADLANHLVTREVDSVVTEA
jgi:excisionase family DNA binding protein